MIRYIIFDKDGTLLDTEPIFKRAWVEVGEKWGLENIAEMYPSIMGNNGEFIIQKLYAAYPDKDCRAYYNERMDRVMELLEGEIPLKTGCKEILEFAKANNIKLAVATSTTLKRAEKNLKKVGICHYFDAIVTGDMVERSKPDPDFFLEAGKRIGAKNDECIICEDSYNGIKAAHASGMRPIFIPDMLPSTKETDAIVYRTCSDLFEVIELIKQENKLN